MVNELPCHKNVKISPHRHSVFVHIEYTSNMAACYDYDVNYVIEPHV